MHFNKKKSAVIYGFILTMVLILCVGYIEGEQMEVTHYTFSILDGKLKDEVRIAQLTDLHSLDHAQKKEEILTKLRTEKPTHVMLTGDIITERNDTFTYQFIKELQTIAPIYYVSGNHEYDDALYDEKVKQLISMNVNVLNNDALDLTEQIRLIGVEDVSKVFTYKQSDKAREFMEARLIEIGNKQVDQTKYNILLYHRPHYVEAFQKGGYNLVLSGHVHGGQWQDPTHSVAAIGPDQGVFPKYFRGKHTFGNMTMINSRGLDYRTQIPRFYNAREIVIVTLK